MKRNDVSKLTLFLSGVKHRLSENNLYFIDAQMRFRSGAKTYNATLVPDGDRFLFTCNAQKRTLDAAGFVAAFLEEAQKYDACILEYHERGSTLIIEADERGVRTRQNAAKSEVIEEDAHDAALLRQRDYIIKPSEAPELLRAIGCLTPDGKLRNDKVRKFNQIDHFLERVRPLIEAIEDETVTVLDCACGKSYLSFALNYFIRDILHRRCFVTGVDISEGVIRESRRIADSLGYRNMEFLQQDLREYNPKKPSLVVSLHACDIATDMAMGLGLRTQAQAIACVPCCHRELLDKYDAGVFAPITRHGVFRARLNDVMTDGLRALKIESMGYEVSVTEYVSPIDTPKNLLVTARRTGQPNPRAEAEYRAMCKALNVYPAIERFSQVIE